MNVRIIPAKMGSEDTDLNVSPNCKRRNHKAVSVNHNFGRHTKRADGRDGSDVVVLFSVTETLDRQ